MVDKFGGQTSVFDKQTHSGEVRINTATESEKFWQGLQQGRGKFVLWMLLLILVMFTLVLSPLILVAFPLVRVLTNKYLLKKRILHEMPMRVPIHAHVADGSNPPANREPFNADNPSPYSAKGSTYMGIDRQTGKQVWLSDDDLLTHVTILGTTKSGKTITILQLMLHAMIKNSGFLYVDAKGDITTLKEICQILRRFGREDDLQIISFLPYEKPEFGNLSKPTNTYNIFMTATATVATENLVAMLDGEEDMWKSRTISFITSLMRLLVALRDANKLELTANKILEYTYLKNIESLVYGDLCKQGRLKEASASLKEYLEGLPSYDKNKANGGEQDSTTKDQHGYVTMQMLRALNDLGYNYGHIFGEENSEIDMLDVVFNRRCLVVSLPALGRTPATLSMLGRIIVSAIKQLMALALGSNLEGSIRLNVDARPSNARNVFLLLLDEVGYFMSEGMSIIPAQGRAFNISAVFSGQSYANLEKSSQLEAQEIWENTNIKIIGRFTGGKDSSTFSKVQGLVGDYWETYIDRFDKERTALGYRYNRPDEVRVRETSRIRIEDLAGQENGEFTIIMSKKARGGLEEVVAIARTRMFFPIPAETTGFVYINETISISTERTPKVNIHAFHETLGKQLQGAHRSIHGLFNEQVLRHADFNDNAKMVIKSLDARGVNVQKSNLYGASETALSAAFSFLSMNLVARTKMDAPNVLDNKAIQTRHVIAACGQDANLLKEDKYYKEALSNSSLDFAHDASSDIKSVQAKRPHSDADALREFERMTPEPNALIDPSNYFGDYLSVLSEAERLREAEQQLAADRQKQAQAIESGIASLNKIQEL